MKRNMRRVIGWTLMLTVLMLTGLPRAEAEDDSKTLPARRVEMAVEYPGVVVFKDEAVEMDITLYNRGRAHEVVNLQVTEKPEGWKTALKTYKFEVTGVHVPSDDQKSVTFAANPPADAPAGDYRFRIAARTPDGAFEMAQAIQVTLKDKTADVSDRGVRLTTSYPVLQGPADGKFEFSMEVDSRLEEDAVFDLFAQGPEGWDIRFKPAYESKFISSVRLKANQSQTIAIEVKPPFNAEAGTYPMQVRASSGAAGDEAALTIKLTGTYALEVGTADGLLSLQARPGKAANVSFYVKNNGSAVNHDISFMSFKPENWEVEFSPEKIDAVAPGELKQVEVRIVPYEEALLGDYSVSISVNGEKASKDIEFRVSVKASSVWGWIGVGIIVLVIGGLAGMFRWLGRR